MTEKIINGIDFHNLDIMKYWSFPSTWDTEKKKRTVNERKRRSIVKKKELN